MITNQIASFGQNAGEGLTSGINRLIDKRRYDEQMDLKKNRLAMMKENQQYERQNKIAEIERQNRAAFEKAEQAAAKGGAQSIISGSPEQRPLLWRGWLDKMKREGYDVTGVPEEYSDEALYRLAGAVGVEIPKAADRKIIKGADKYNYYADTGERVLPNVGVASGGGFEGTGIENQMLNIFLDKSISDSDPRKILAKQRLSRERTVVTPDGTYVVPGYNLEELGGKSTPSKASGFTEKPSTEGEKQAAGYYDRMVAAEGEISSLPEGFEPTSVTEFARGSTNVTASSEYQRYKQAANDWIRAKLRKESGAVIGDEEMQTEFETYFPQFGDRDAVIAQKSRAREIATNAMKRAGGRAIKDTGQADPITQHHLNNLNNGTAVKNPDGSVSTVRTIQVDLNGKPTLIPTVWDGQIVSDQEAVQRAIQSGVQWPTADTHEQLRQFDINIHKKFDKDLEKSQYGRKGPQKGAVEDGYEFLGGDPSDPKSWKKQ